MRTGAIIVLLGLAAAAGCQREQPEPQAKVQAPAPAAPAESAETLYARAWEGMSRELRSAAASVAISPQGPRADARAPVTDFAEIERVLETNQPVIELLLEASSRPSATFTDERQGIRDAARILRADAWRLWKRGDLEGATRRLEAIYSMCRQTLASRDPLMVMVNMAVLALAHESVRDMSEADPTFSKAQAARLNKALDAFDADDPARILKAHGSSLDRERTESLRAQAADQLALARQALAHLADPPG